MAKFKRKIPNFIDAVRLNHEMVMFADTGELSILGNIGDWLLTRKDGSQFCMKNSKFMEQFEPADDDAEMYLERHGTVVIEPKDFEDIVNHDKKIVNKLGDYIRPKFVRTKLATDAMEMFDRELALRHYNNLLHQKSIEELREKLNLDQETDDRHGC